MNIWGIYLLMGLLEQLINLHCCELWYEKPYI
jgi:hypothetical protein